MKFLERIFPQNSALNGGMNTKMNVNASGCEVKLLKLQRNRPNVLFPRSILSIRHAQLTRSKLPQACVRVVRGKQTRSTTTADNASERFFGAFR